MALVLITAPEAISPASLRDTSAISRLRFAGVAWGVCRGARLKVSCSIPAHQSHDPGEQHRSDDGDQDADDEAVLSDSP